MNSFFADRITDVPRSFIREILKDALMPGTISFAGGLPNRKLFPAKELVAATEIVYRQRGEDVFQYSNSEGLWELRESIAKRYAQRGLEINPSEILITSGSQQGLDLIGKILLNEGDGLVIEEPGYLGAIQAFSLYRPKFLPVTVSEHGIDTDQLKASLIRDKAKLIYTVPNFQNPSGVTYPEENRQQVADLVRGTNTLLIEDDPYGDLRFAGAHKSMFKALIPDNTLLLGSFSKTVVPGFRIGWIVAPERIAQKLLIAKQAADLHTNQLCQCIIHQYLQDNDINAHVQLIIAEYRKQKEAMVAAISRHFPNDVTHTDPEGGMFLWATLPTSLKAIDLFESAAKDKVVFVPGDPFYINKKGVNTLRLNFSCVDTDSIETGIAKLGNAIKSLIY